VIYAVVYAVEAGIVVAIKPFTGTSVNMNIP
jgi:hypothetical protein